MSPHTLVLGGNVLALAPEDVAVLRRLFPDEATFSTLETKGEVKVKGSDLAALSIAIQKVGVASLRKEPYEVWGECTPPATRTELNLLNWLRQTLGLSDLP